MLCLGDILTILIGFAPEAAWDHPIERVVVDSRNAGPHTFFVALPGENVDGHNYVAAALVNGAVAALISRDIDFAGLIITDADIEENRANLDPNWQTPFCIRVADSLTSLQQLARVWRQKFSPTVTGITGSVGKTSTKELTYRVLAQKYKTFKSEGNLNGDIGLPMTVLALTDDYEQAVLEMGMYRLGEIKLLCQIARPQIGVVTNVQPSHLARLKTIEQIAAAKRELVENLPSEGTAILNLDDPLVAAMRDHTPAQVFSYGLSDKADLWADQVSGEGLAGTRFTLHYQGEAVPVRTSLLGQHSVYTALAATAVGLSQGLTWTEITAGLEDEQARTRLVAVPAINQALILDDTYNASATSGIAALNLLQDLEGRRKIAVLGAMAELGSFEDEAHRLVGQKVADVADVLITVGPKAALIATEAKKFGLNKAAIHQLSDKPSVLAMLQQIMSPGDIVLIKGSRSLAMETIVNNLSSSTAQTSKKAHV